MSGFLPRGRHLLADLHGVAPERLTDPVAIEALLREPPAPPAAPRWVATSTPSAPAAA